jgi:hypothetical protein
MADVSNVTQTANADEPMALEESREGSPDLLEETLTEVQPNEEPSGVNEEGDKLDDSGSVRAADDTIQEEVNASNEQDESREEKDPAIETIETNDSLSVTPSTAKRGRKKKRRDSEDNNVLPPSKVSPSNLGHALFNCIKKGKSAFQVVVSDWVTRYQKDPQLGMLELIQYIIRCTGCEAIITPLEYRNEESANIIRKLTKEFCEISYDDYPLTMTGPEYKRFKSNYSTFIMTLIEKCGEDILFDEFMVDSLVMWLVGLSDSQIRAFRHTSTLAALKIVTSLINVILKTNKAIDNTQRQIDTERRRSSSRRPTAVLNKLQSSMTTLQQQSTELHEMIRTLFSSVFVHRYRDIRPELRAICISELGVWIKTYSKEFLADNYTKYIGWTLSDKVGEVRLQSLLSLIPLYATSDFVLHLELFTEKFIGRIVAMKLDKEDNVAIAAINLLCNMLELNILEPEDCTEICEMVFIENKNIARTAGKFTVKYLFSEDFMSKARLEKPPDGHQQMSDSHIKLKELVRFFLEVKIHQHAHYIVDSLWEHADVLQDWDTYVDVLTNNTCGITLTNEEEITLIELLVCSAFRAAGCSPLGARGKLSSKEKKIIEFDREKLSHKLIPVISQLLAKYGTEVEAAVGLTKIPQFFDLEYYVELRAQKHLEDLLLQLKELTLKHSNQEVLDEISCTYRHLLDAEFTLHSIVDVSFSQLVDDLYANITDGLELLKEQSMFDNDNEDVYNLSVAITRINLLLKQVNLENFKFVEDFLNIVEMGVDSNTSDSLVIPCLQCLQLHIMWSLYSLESIDPDRTQLRYIRNLLDSLMRHSFDLIKLGTNNVQNASFTIICDLLVVFAKQLSSHGNYGGLVYIANSSHQATLSDYVTDKVFNESEIDDEPTTEEEAQIQADTLYLRRQLLGGYLKLVVYGLIDIKSSAGVIAQFYKFNADYGDLIKFALTRVRDSDHITWSKGIFECLKKECDKLPSSEDGNIQRDAIELLDLKELAKKLATLFVHVDKMRVPILTVLSSGIDFIFGGFDGDLANAPHRVMFFQVLTEFGSKVYHVDRHIILTRIKNVFDGSDHSLVEIMDMDGWEDLNKFVNVMCSNGLQEYADIVGELQVQEPPAKKKGRGLKRGIVEGDSRPQKMSKRSLIEE